MLTLLLHEFPARDDDSCVQVGALGLVLRVLGNGVKALTVEAVQILLRREIGYGDRPTLSRHRLYVPLVGD